MTYQAVDIATGEPLSGKIITTMTQNDEWLRNKVIERPKGVVFHKQGFNVYNETFDHLYTDSNYDGTGTGKASMFRVIRGAFTAEPNRYYAFLSSCLTSSSGAGPTGGLMKYRLFINGTSSQTYNPQNNSVASPADAEYESTQLWHIWQSPEQMEVQKTLFSVRISIADNAGGAGTYPIAKVWISSSWIPFVTVFDMGAVSRETTSV